MPIKGTRYSFNKKNVDGSPEKPGVYALFDGDKCIYIGKASKSIRTRLQCHLRGDEGRCTQQATDYWRLSCSSPEDAERQMLIDYVMEHGRAPRCNEVMP